MRSLVALSLFAVACGGSRPNHTVPAPPATGTDTGAAPAPAPPPTPIAAEPTPEMIAADTPKATVAGNTFVAPAGWSMTVKGTATILTPPEGDSHIALVDVQAKNADQAVTLAWAAYSPDKKYELDLSTAAPPQDGWQEIQGYRYIVSPNEKRGVGASARFANGQWLVTIYDMADAVGEKRASQVGVIYGKLLPKGYERESFAGKKPNEAHARSDQAASRFRRGVGEAARSSRRLVRCHSERQDRVLVSRGAKLHLARTPTARSRS